MTTPVAAVDYHIGFSCRLKRRFSLVQLAPIVHAEGGPEALIARYAPAFDDGHEVAPLVRSIPGDNGLEDQVVPPADVARRAEAVRRFRRTCKDCPANLDRGREGFGCFGVLSLPIAAETEAALMAIIARIMEGGDDIDPAAPAPIRYVWDNGLDGASVATLRAGDAWLKADEPVSIRVGPFLEKRAISSDQVFQIFLSEATVRLEYAVLFTAFFAEVERLAGEMPNVGPAAPLVRFFRALHLAGDLGVHTHLTPLPSPQDTATQPTVPDMDAVV